MLFSVHMNNQSSKAKDAAFILKSESVLSVHFRMICSKSLTHSWSFNFPYIFNVGDDVRSKGKCESVKSM